MARERHLLGEELGALFSRNGTLFTGFAVLLIIVSGVTVIDDSSKWWVSIVAVLSLAVVAFLFMNARVFIKAAVTLFLLSVLGSYAFKIGATLDPVGLGGSLWMTTMIATFFVCLAVSYLRQSARSRWGAAGLTLVLHFILTLLLTTSGVTVPIAVCISTTASFIVFSLLYFYGRGSRFKALEMPVVTLSEETAENLKKAAIETGRGGWRRKVKHSDSVVVWNEEVAFQLLEVEFTQKLGVGGGRRSTYLTHLGNNINPWLLQIVNRFVSLWGVRNADLLLVLLDTNNKNGDKPKVIGVETPDSKRKVAVGILPAKHLLSESKHEKLFSTIEKEFGDFALKLTPRQLNALDSHLPDENESETVKESLEEQEV